MITFKALLTLIKMLVECANYCTNDKERTYINCYDLERYGNDFAEWDIFCFDEHVKIYLRQLDTMQYQEPVVITVYDKFAIILQKLTEIGLI